MIDVDVFEQLLEMDEDDREFSQSLVWNYFEQAESTFQKMDGALYVDKDGGTYNYRIAKSLEELSTLCLLYTSPSPRDS